MGVNKAKRPDIYLLMKKRPYGMCGRDSSWPALSSDASVPESQV